MVATAMAQEAAELAATDQAAKEAALAAAAVTARTRHDAYEVAKALANEDAMHRARRSAITAGTVAQTEATAPALCDQTTPAAATAEAAAAVATAQALRAPTARECGAAEGLGQNRPSPTVMNRLGQYIGCYALVAGQSGRRRRRKKAHADGKHANA